MPTCSLKPITNTVHNEKEKRMRTVKRRVHQLEAAYNVKAQVYAIHLVDVDAYQVVLGAPREYLPAALFWERYPTARIVKTLAAAAMWGEI